MSALEHVAAAHQVDLRHNVILYMEDVSVSVDGCKAINDLNLHINVGELRCIIGPNGAGKTTMMDIITGKTRPDKGSVFLGQNINLLKLDETEIARSGIGRKFQKPTVFESLTVFDNLELSLSGSKSVWLAFNSRLSDQQLNQIDEVLATIGLKNDSQRLAGELSHGQKQWLEIGMLLMQEPKLLLVDEPVAGMTHGEIEKTAELLQGLAGKQAIVVVEHDMEFVRMIAKTVTVLHQGSVLVEGSLSKVQNDPRVIEVYLGGH